MDFGLWTGDRGDGLQRAAADEDAQATQQRLLRLPEQVVAPLEHHPQPLGSLWRVTRPAGQEIEPVVEALQTRRDTLQKLVTSLSQISNAVGGDGERLGDLANSLDATLKVIVKPKSTK